MTCPRLRTSSCELRERKEKLEIAAEEAGALAERDRRQFLDSADVIATFAEDMSEFLKYQRADRDQGLRSAPSSKR